MTTLSLKLSLIAAGLLATSVATAADRNPQMLKTFSTSDPTISKDLKATEEKSWVVNSSKPQIIRLFEVADPGVDDCTVTYRARLRSKGLNGQAYLEMWCRFPGKGEFFSRGLENPISGSNDWASYETPFFLKTGEQPDLIKLNLVIKGTGKIWIKDIELLKGPLPKN